MSHDKTLRQQFQDRFAEVDWTSELEADFVSGRKVVQEDVFSAQSLQTPEAASLVQGTEQVYPSIPGFGNLDIGAMPAGLRFMVDSFCQALAELTQDRDNQGLYSSLAKWMLPGRSYMLVILLHDTSSYPGTGQYFLGAPHGGEGTWEIPVLFRGERGDWIMVLHAVQVEGDWRLEQLRYGDFAYE